MPFRSHKSTVLLSESMFFLMLYLLLNLSDYLLTWLMIRVWCLPVLEANPISAWLLANNIPLPLSFFFSPVIYLAMKYGGHRVAKAIVVMACIPLISNSIVLALLVTL